MIDLDAWLDIISPAEGTKWTLNSANGITDSGLIVGDGYFDDGPGGQSDGFRACILDANSLVVPEPSTIVLAVTAAVIMGLASARPRRCSRHHLLS